MPLPSDDQIIQYRDHRKRQLLIRCINEGNAELFKRPSLIGFWVDQLHLHGGCTGELQYDGYPHKDLISAKAVKILYDNNYISIFFKRAGYDNERICTHAELKLTMVALDNFADLAVPERYIRQLNYGKIELLMGTIKGRRSWRTERCYESLLNIMAKVQYDFFYNSIVKTVVNPYTIFNYLRDDTLHYMYESERRYLVDLLHYGLSWQLEQGMNTREILKFTAKLNGHPDILECLANYLRTDKKHMLLICLLCNLAGGEHNDGFETVKKTIAKDHYVYAKLVDMTKKQKHRDLWHRLILAPQQILRDFHLLVEELEHKPISSDNKSARSVSTIVKDLKAILTARYVKIEGDRFMRAKAPSSQDLNILLIALYYGTDQDINALLKPRALVEDSKSGASSTSAPLYVCNKSDRSCIKDWVKTQSWVSVSQSIYSRPQTETKDEVRNNFLKLQVLIAYLGTQCLDGVDETVCKSDINEYIKSGRSLDLYMALGYFPGLVFPDQTEKFVDIKRLLDYFLYSKSSKGIESTYITLEKKRYYLLLAKLNLIQFTYNKNSEQLIWASRLAYIVSQIDSDQSYSLYTDNDNTRKSSSREIFEKAWCVSELKDSNPQFTSLIKQLINNELIILKGARRNQLYRNLHDIFLELSNPIKTNKHMYLLHEISSVVAEGRRIRNMFTLPDSNIQYDIGMNNMLIGLHASIESISSLCESYHIEPNDLFDFLINTYTQAGRAIPVEALKILVQQYGFRFDVECEFEVTRHSAMPLMNKAEQNGELYINPVDENYRVQGSYFAKLLMGNAETKKPLLCNKGLYYLIQQCPDGLNKIIKISITKEVERQLIVQSISHSVRSIVSFYSKNCLFISNQMAHGLIWTEQECKELCHNLYNHLALIFDSDKSVDDTSLSEYQSMPIVKLFNSIIDESELLYHTAGQHKPLQNLLISCVKQKKMGLVHILMCLGVGAYIDLSKYYEFIDEGYTYLEPKPPVLENAKALLHLELYSFLYNKNIKHLKNAVQLTYKLNVWCKNPLSAGERGDYYLSETITRFLWGNLTSASVAVNLQNCHDLQRIQELSLLVIGSDDKDTVVHLLNSRIKELKEKLSGTDVSTEQRVFDQLHDCGVEISHSNLLHYAIIALDAENSKFFSKVLNHHNTKYTKFVSADKSYYDICFTIQVLMNVELERKVLGKAFIECLVEKRDFDVNRTVNIAQYEKVISDYYSQYEQPVNDDSDQTLAEAKLLSIGVYQTSLFQLLCYAQRVDKHGFLYLLSIGACSALGELKLMDYDGTVNRAGSSNVFNEQHRRSLETYYQFLYEDIYLPHINNSKVNPANPIYIVNSIIELINSNKCNLSTMINLLVEYMTVRHLFRLNKRTKIIDQLLKLVIKDDSTSRRIDKDDKVVLPAIRISDKDIASINSKMRDLININFKDYDNMAELQSEFIITEHTFRYFDGNQILDVRTNLLCHAFLRGMINVESLIEKVEQIKSIVSNTIRIQSSSYRANDSACQTINEQCNLIKAMLILEESIPNADEQIRGVFTALSSFNTCASSNNGGEHQLRLPLLTEAEDISPWLKRICYRSPENPQQLCMMDDINFINRRLELFARSGYDLVANVNSPDIIANAALVSVFSIDKDPYEKAQTSTVGYFDAPLLAALFSYNHNILVNTVTGVTARAEQQLYTTIHYILDSMDSYIYAMFESSSIPIDIYIKLQKTKAKIYFGALSAICNHNRAHIHKNIAKQLFQQMIMHCYLVSRPYANFQLSYTADEKLWHELFHYADNPYLVELMKSCTSAFDASMIPPAASVNIRDVAVSIGSQQGMHDYNTFSFNFNHAAIVDSPSNPLINCEMLSSLWDEKPIDADSLMNLIIDAYATTGTIIPVNVLQFIITKMQLDINNKSDFILNREIVCEIEGRESITTVRDRVNCSYFARLLIGCERGPLLCNDGIRYLIDCGADLSSSVQISAAGNNAESALVENNDDSEPLVEDLIDQDVEVSLENTEADKEFGLETEQVSLDIQDSDEQYEVMDMGYGHDDELQVDLGPEGHMYAEQSSASATQETSNSNHEALNTRSILLSPSQIIDDDFYTTMTETSVYVLAAYYGNNKAFINNDMLVGVYELSEQECNQLIFLLARHIGMLRHKYNCKQYESQRYQDAQELINLTPVLGFYDYLIQQDVIVDGFIEKADLFALCSKSTLLGSLLLKAVTEYEQGIMDILLRYSVDPRYCVVDGEAVTAWEYLDTIQSSSHHQSVMAIIHKSDEAYKDRRFMHLAMTMFLHDGDSSILELAAKYCREQANTSKKDESRFSLKAKNNELFSELVNKVLNKELMLLPLSLRIPKLESLKRAISKSWKIDISRIEQYQLPKVLGGKIEQLLKAKSAYGQKLNLMRQQLEICYPYVSGEHDNEVVVNLLLFTTQHAALLASLERVANNLGMTNVNVIEGLLRHYHEKVLNLELNYDSQFVKLSLFYLENRLQQRHEGMILSAAEVDRLKQRCDSIKQAVHNRETLMTIRELQFLQKVIMSKLVNVSSIEQAEDLFIKLQKVINTKIAAKLEVGLPLTKDLPALNCSDENRVFKSIYRHMESRLISDISVKAQESINKRINTLVDKIDSEYATYLKQTPMQFMNMFTRLSKPSVYILMYLAINKLDSDSLVRAILCNIEQVQTHLDEIKGRIIVQQGGLNMIQEVIASPSLESPVLFNEIKAELCEVGSRNTQSIVNEAMKRHEDEHKNLFEL